MKRKHLLLICTFAISLFALSSCGGDDPTPPPPPPPPVDELTSLTITSDKTTVLDNTGDVFTFSVIGNDGVNYTTTSTIYVNSSPISGNTFSANDNSGIHSVYAKYGDIQSNALNLIILGENITFENITISADVDGDAALNQKISFTVMGKVVSEGNFNITSLVQLYVNGEAVDGTTFTPTVAQSYSIYAKIGTQTSNTITITVTAAPSGYKHKVLIEDFTGAWCPYCTRILYAIDLLHAQTNDVLIAAIHRGNSSGGYYDPFNVPEGATLESTVPGFEGYPTAWIGRSKIWTYPEPNNLAQPQGMLKTSSPYGIAISSTLGASSGSIDISVAFDESLSSAKLVVYVLEDNLILNQANGYSDLYGGKNPIPNFSHQDVVRKVVTNILGNAIPADKTTAGSTYTTTLSANYTSANVANLKVMAFILDSAGKVVNVRVVSANTTNDFERL